MASKIKPFYRMAMPFIMGIVGVQILVAALAVVMLALSDHRSAEESGQRFDRQAATLINLYLQGLAEYAKQMENAPLPASPTATLPGARLIRIIPDGAEIPKDLGFTHQDMLRRAIQTRSAINPEASHVQGEGVMISLVRPLREGGYLLLGFSSAPLEAALKALADQSGGVVLRQKIGAAGEVTDVLALNGGDGLKPSTQKIQNPNWSLAVRPAPEDSPFLIVLIALVVAVLLVPALSVLLVRMYDQKFRHDLEALHGVTKGNELSSPLHFDTMQEIWSLLTSVIGKHHGVAQGAKASSEIRTHDVAGIVQDAEDSLLMPLPPKAETLEVHPEVPVAHELPTPEQDEAIVEESVRELSPLEFTLSKPGASGVAKPSGIPSQVFRDYDIRGKAGSEISDELARWIGQSIGTEALERGERIIVVGRDVRLSSETLCRALIAGLTETGCDVIDVGVVPSPVLYFSAKSLGSGSGVMVTASHNPAPDNGFKIMLANHTLGGQEIQALHDRIVRKDFAKGAGSVVQNSVSDEYIQRITDDVLLARTFNIVVDAGNGVAGPLAVRMLEELGCTVSPLYCEPDGHFPHHDPDPSRAENLEDLLSDVAISGADLGLAFDGDGDRVVVVTNSTKIVPSDRLLMLFAREVLATQPGADILFDVKCSRDLVSVITTNGGRPVMTKTGHTWLKAGVAETGAPLAGEMSGHYIFNDRWSDFDDGLYAAARFLEILSQSMGTADDLFSGFPERVVSPELRIPVSDEEKAHVMERLVAQQDEIFDGTVNTTDGLRVEFAGGWGVVRASNTGSYLIAKFEGNSEEEMEQVKAFFRERLKDADPMMLLPF